MSFTTLTITGTVQFINSLSPVGTSVSMTLSGEITDGTSTIYPETVEGVCNSSGNFSISGILANNDPTTAPQGTVYNVTIMQWNNELDSFSVVVPYTAAPSIDLFNLARVTSQDVALSSLYAVKATS